MNILLVSQCEKRALSETRRILDQFAERRGERTWQTPITQAGLDTLRRLLKKSARRNTAVACHWIRGRDHSELLWIVGDASRFNAQGAVPTNRTRRDILRKEDENDWHSAEDIRLLTVMAALFHDIGKTRELSAFPENDYTDDGQLLGHIIIGTEMVSERIREIPRFPEKLAAELKHCILAHHGELEYGSPKKPALFEAVALSLADNADAKLETMNEIIAGAGDNNGWLGYNRLFESNLRKTSI